MDDSEIRRKLAGYCGLLAPITILTLIISAIYTSPDFNITEHALSTLGVTPGFPSILFNSALIIGGLLIIPFSLRIRESINGGKFLGFLFTLVSLDLIMVGIFHQGHPLHVPLAASLFSLLPAILITLGIFNIKSDSYTLGELEIISGIAAIAIWMLPWAGKGIPELVVALICSAWVMKKGAEILKNK